MTYYYSKTVRAEFDEAVSRVSQALKVEGFGILTEIDVKSTLKKKLNVDFRKTEYLVPVILPLLTRRCKQRIKSG
jgi:uncharacterized protein (DUF302 family)